MPHNDKSDLDPRQKPPPAPEDNPLNAAPAAPGADLPPPPEEMEAPAEDPVDLMPELRALLDRLEAAVGPRA